MKKNTMMRLASFLLIAVLITTSAISGTYAKYVTQDSASDTARVAKWGIDVQVGGSLFGKYYEAHSTSGGDVITAAAADSVDTSDDTTIVAPGTKNQSDEGFTISITGIPEVSYEITATSNGNKDIYLGVGKWGVMVEAKGLNAASNIVGYYTKDDSNVYTEVTTGTYSSTTTYYELQDAVEVMAPYYPINWAVAHTGNATQVTETKDLTTIASKMVNGIKTTTTQGANDSAAASYVLTWEWPFHTSDANDKMDTILGNLAAATNVVYMGTSETNYKKATANDNTTNCLQVALDFEVTVTQVN